MLPDFPEPKAKLFGHLASFLQQRLFFHLGFFGQCPRITIPEGETARLFRSDGSSEDMEMHPATGQFTIPSDQELISDQEILGHLDSVAKQMAEDMKKVAFKTVEDATRKTGNVFEAKLSELGLDHFVEMLKKMWVDFNPDGTPQMPSVVCHTDVYNKLIEREEKGLNEEAKKRMAEVMEIKRMEFLDRESRRRLAD